jgi:predicted phage tail protein
VYLPAGAPAVTTPASNNTGSYTVSWSAVATATSYQVEESANGGGWTLIHNAAGGSKAISGKGTGSYAYRARACNAAGCGGNSATATTQVTLPPAGVPTMTVPATSTTGSYTVSWSAVSGATSYLLEEQTNGGGWVQIYNAAGGSLTISGKGNGSYNYRVKGCNLAGCAGWSAGAGITVSLPPMVPTGIVAKYMVINYSPPWQVRVMVSWNVVPGATRYEVYLGATKFYDGNMTSTQYIYMGSPSTLPSVTMRACNESGCSASSAPISATPQ